MNPFVLKKVVLTIQKFMNLYDPLCRLKLNSTILEKYPPIFIVGAPRSGSTLLYQLLLKYGNFSYISNLMALFPVTMVYLDRLFASFNKVHSIKKSNFGYIPGLFSPSESGAIFYKWFNLSLPEKERMIVRRTVACLTKRQNNSLMIKNLNNSLRLYNIYNIFPEAKFIFLKRDPRFVAQSILLARRHINFNEKTWWSVAPPGHEQILQKEPLYQITWQVNKINYIVENFFNKYAANYICVNYEDLCEYPEHAMYRMLFFLSNSFHNVKIKNIPSLSNENKVKLNRLEWEKIEFYLKKL